MVERDDVAPLREARARFAISSYDMAADDAQACPARRWTTAMLRASLMRIFAALLGMIVPMSCSAGSSAPIAARSGHGERVRSNVLRGDYAGSAACAGCHQQIHDDFMRSPMHRMTRAAVGDAISAPFDGTTFSFKGESVTVEEHGGHKYMRLSTAKLGTRVYRITKVIGGRTREDYAGVEVSDGPIRHDLPRHAKSERIMPLSYLLFSSTWRYKGYSVMVPERPYLTLGVAWRQTCIFCHNTAPHLSTLYDDLLPDGAGKYQGSISDRVLPPSRTWSYQVRDAGALSRALATEVRHLGGEADDDLPVEEALSTALRTTRDRFDAPHLVELGIGCESCHNGSKEHVADPRLLPTFEIASSAIGVRTATGTASRAEWINRTCARCHTVLFNQYPHTWEGGQRSSPSAGGSHINSGEARDFLLGGCAGAMACTSCHDPHRGSDPKRLEELGTTAGNAVCTGCHGHLATPESLARHSHHRPDGAGSACLSCHMPRKNMGLGYGLTRYHRIGSPTDRARVEHDRPLECALCHADMPAAALVDHMERWWNKRYDRARLRDLYGDLGSHPLLATLAAGKPHEVAVAVAVLGERGARSAAPQIAEQLTHPYPLVRLYARSALERLGGRPMTIDLDAEPAVIRTAAGRWLAELPPRAP
jgi:predicted CXXCH cytochrome family protein